MPWMSRSTMSLRLEFIQLALSKGASIRSLTRRFGISAKTAYKWLRRYREGGSKALQDQSRRPHSSPRRTSVEMEQVIVELRTKHPRWGARKLHTRLIALGYHDLPSISTITAIVRRHGLLDPGEALKHRPWQRFEAECPNVLWQMDFKGHIAIQTGRCHPLTILDDHSRFNIGLQACPDETHQTVQHHLVAVFRRYGLPCRFLVDNGTPWGARDGEWHTKLTVWLLRLGIGVIHARPYHPQTLGKDERFHRTLRAEVLADAAFASLQDCQHAFDRWRLCYNTERPHEALGMATPVSRYQPSPREFPEALPPIEYGPEDIVRKVQGKGEISFRNRIFVIGRAFHGYPIALRPTLTDGLFDIYFCKERITQINLKLDILQP